MSKIKEECGVFGIIDDKPINAVGQTVNALLALQHRGQESAGIVTFFGDNVFTKKDLGMVNDIFDQKYIDSFPNSYVTVGHVRYSTNGTRDIESAQPITVTHKEASFALAHNGSLTNADELRQRITMDGGIFYTTTDSEVINDLILKQMKITGDFEQAIFNCMDILEGAYSIVVATGNHLYALRDKNGFRPLCMGKLGSATVFASESCAFDAIGAEFIRDIKPGELVKVDQKGNVTVRQKDVSNRKRGLCVFEFVYFARPDSVIDGISVHEARMKMGEYLYQQQPIEADMVCGVPDSGISAAYGYAKASGIPYGSAFIKNRYVGRSFILPTQIKREKAVSVKLNPLRSAVKDKRIILIDDSIVRGTTSAKIIRSLREAGAKEIHSCISSPPFKFPCYFGTDVDSRENLIANKMDIEGIRKTIGADSLVFLSYENVMKIKFGQDISFCGGCFDGNYPIDITEPK